MAKTYLQLVNLVHGYLRGPTVTEVNADADTIIIANFLNQAKERVESAWKWNILRKTITFNGSASTYTYDTSDAGVATVNQTNERSVLLFDQENRPLFWDVTSGGEFRLEAISRERAQSIYRLDQSTTTSPSQFTAYRLGSGLTIFFPVAPSGTRNYSFEAYVPQAELSAKTDELTVPWRPVVMLATSLAAGERGDEFGAAQQMYMDLYEDAIATEIAFDQEGQEGFDLESDQLSIR